MQERFASKKNRPRNRLVNIKEQQARFANMSADRAKSLGVFYQSDCRQRRDVEFMIVRISIDRKL
jgi:hypothetical protein